MLVCVRDCSYESGSPSENYTLDTANRIYVDQTVGIQGWAFRVLKDKVKTIDFRQVRRPYGMLGSV